MELLAYLAIIVVDIAAVLMIQRRHARALSAGARAELPGPERSLPYLRGLLEEAADVLDLQVEQRGPGVFVKGTREGFEIKVETIGGLFPDEPQATSLRLELLGGDRLPAAIAMSPKRLDTWLARSSHRRAYTAIAWSPSQMLRPPSHRVELKGTRFVSHDPALDSAFDIAGDARILRALLDAPTRSAALELRRELTVDAGKLVLTSARPTASAAALVEFIEGAIAMARRFELADPEVPGRLREIADEDPIDLVRFEALRSLLSFYPDRAETEEVLEGAIDDRHAEVRLLAASHYGERGLPTLEALSEDEQLGAHVRVKALRHWARRVSNERAAAVLNPILLDHDHTLHRAVVPLARTPENVAALAILIASSPPTEMLLCAAESLGHIPGNAAERALLELLKSKDPEVRRTAAVSLAHNGTAMSLPVLHQIANGLFTETELRERARRAVTRIRARLGEVQPGALSLSEGPAEDGALSLSSEPGALSHASEEED